MEVPRSAIPTPPVERVVPGLWAIPVPIPNNPLGHTNVYAFETDRGPVLVDSGWDDDSSWNSLVGGLGEAGFAASDVYGVLVTHMHPDHHGLSGRVHEASGAWIAMHPKDASLLPKMSVTKAEKEFVDEVAMMLLDAGATEDEIVIRKRASSKGPRPPMIVPDRELADGERVDVPGWQVEALWTPGHSPGHTCFKMLDHGMLLAGDHVLPTITPHIGMSRADRHGDPLGDFLASLLKVDQPDITTVLPAHEHRFDHLGTRVHEIIAHHEAHLAALVVALSAGPKTLWELAKMLEWNRPWAELDQMMHRAAVNETAAHMRHLTRRGLAERVKGLKPITFQAANRAPDHDHADGLDHGHSHGSGGHHGHSHGPEDHHLDGHAH
jgi:glyoxylase-like metal-dependent hydrolase (beta-lactamase superfamily II)